MIAILLPAVVVATALNYVDDSFLTGFKTMMSRPATEFSIEKVRYQWDNAKKPGAKPMDRFRFASYVVAAFDKKSISRPDSMFLATEASSLLKVKELELSPSYSYVVARLGLIHLKITALETEAANRYYRSSRGGVSANILARVLSFNESLAVRAKSLTYALEAKSLQKDSVKLRWLVAGAYLFKADFTKEKQYFEASIREYEGALELAKSGKDKDYSSENLETIKFYLKKSKDGLKELKK